MTGSCRRCREGRARPRGTLRSIPSNHHEGSAFRGLWCLATKERPAGRRRGGARLRSSAALLFFSLALASCNSVQNGPSRNDSDALLVLGRTGYGPREFSYPRAIAISSDDQAYIVDKTGRVQHYNERGEWLSSWNTPEIDAGKPTGLGVGPDGTVWVADTHYSRVLVYTSGGLLLRQFGTYGEQCGQFHLPTDVAVSADGGCYVGEYGGNDRVSRFAPSGDCLGFFGDGSERSETGRTPDRLKTGPTEHRLKAGSTSDRLEAGAPSDSPVQLARPQGIHIAKDGTLWIADSRNHRVCHLTAEGELLGAFGEMGTEIGKLRFPYGLDQLSDGTLVVAEYGNNRVQRFEQDGGTRGVWGSPGREANQLAYPWAVAVDSKDRVWVVDSGNNRVQVIAGMDDRTWRRK